MGDTRFIVAGSFIDGSGAEMRRNIFLAVREGKISAIGTRADLPCREQTAIEDFSHCTILPALVDCSISLSRSPSVDWQVRLAAEEAELSQQLAMVEKHVSYCQDHGVLAVADSDDRTGLVARYREGVPSAKILTVRTSGPLLRSRHDDAPAASTDFLKIGYSPSIEEENTNSPRFTPEELCRLLARRGPKKAVVVANGRQPVAQALAAGCDAIEQGYGMGEENLRSMAEQGVLWIPNLLRAKNALDGAGSGGSVCCRFSQRYVAPGKPVPGAETYWKKLVGEHLRLLGLARSLGVTAAVGSGAGSVGIIHGESVVEELKLFVKAGYSREEAIRSASAIGARFFALEELGPLTVGRPATFLIARGTVQQLPRKLSYLEGIYVNGRPCPNYRKNPVKIG